MSSEAEFRFEIFRFPKPKLDRKMAIEWLDNHYWELSHALHAGYYSDDKKTREDFAYLAMDFSHVVEACIHVLQTGKPVKVAAFEASVDVPDHNRMLARVMASRDLLDDREPNLGERGFDKLTRMFVERIEPENLSGGTWRT